MLSNSLQGIGEHYIVISLEEVHIAGDFENKTAGCFLWCQDKFADALPQLRAGSFGIAS